MSLAIDVDIVTHVLLADGWHAVAEKSFAIDSYEFIWGKQVLLGGGQEPLLSARGCTWKEHGSTIVFCPLSAVLALKSTLHVMREAYAVKGKPIDPNAAGGGA